MGLEGERDIGLRLHEHGVAPDGAAQLEREAGVDGEAGIQFKEQSARQAGAAAATVARDSGSRRRYRALDTLRALSHRWGGPSSSVAEGEADGLD